jgi:hypothetical protein
MGARRLPVVPRPYRDELLSSWLGRVACRYGLDGVRLSGALVAGVEGVAPPILVDDIAPATDQMELLAPVCGVDPARLRRLSLAWRHPGRPRAWFSSQGPSWAPKALRSPPVCFACFGADRAEGLDSYLRADWMLAERCVCPAHRRLLRDRCPHCRRRLQLEFRLREERARLVCSRCEQELAGQGEEGGEALDGATVGVLLALQEQIAAFVRSDPRSRLRIEAAIATLWAPLDDPGAARLALALWIDESGWRCPTEVQHAIGAAAPLGRLPIGWRVVTLIAFHALFELGAAGTDEPASAYLARRTALPRSRPATEIRRTTPPSGDVKRRPLGEYRRLAHEILAHPDWIAAASAPARRRRVSALEWGESAHQARTQSGEQTQNPTPGKAFWVLSAHQTQMTPADAQNPAFFAGAGLALLDAILHGGADVSSAARDRNPPFSGALRQRLALRAAVSCAAMARLREDVSALRDAEHLAPGGEATQTSPAGRIHRLWRLFATRPLRLDAATLRIAADFVGLSNGLNFDGLAKAVRDIASNAEHPLAATAGVSAAAMKLFTGAPLVDTEIFALWLSDLALSKRLGWAAPVPLLATAIAHPPLRRGSSGKRPRPGDPDWADVMAGAYALAAREAYALAVELTRRSQSLLASAPKLRAKGAGRVIELLLFDDAVSPARAAKTARLSDRAARRLFDRLIQLGAVRELSGRPNFRLYGL